MSKVMSLTMYESLSVSCITQAYKAFVDGRATTITSAKIYRLESIGMVWDAQKGGNRKRKNCESNDDNFMVSGRKSKFSLSDCQNESIFGTMKTSALKESFGQLHDQETQEHREVALKKIEIMSVEELVNNSITSSRHDSGNKNQALKISRGPAIEKVTKNHVCDDGDYATLLNLTSIRNTDDSTSLSTTKHFPLLYPRSAVKELLHKTSKVVDSQHQKSKFVDSDAINPSHSRKCFVPKLKSTGNDEFNGFNGSHRNEGTGLACSNGDATSESDNHCHTLLLGYPPKEIKKNHEKVDIHSLPFMTEMQKVKSNLRYVDTDQSTSAMTNAHNKDCELVTTKPSEVFLVEALKAGRELTTHMPAESIEEVYFFLETMKWRNTMNVLMALQYQISSDLGLTKEHCQYFTSQMYA